MSKRFLPVIIFLCHANLFAQSRGGRYSEHPDSIATHRVVLDHTNQIVSWMGPPPVAYNRFLKDRWNFILRAVPNAPGPAPRSDYPQYYFYCAYKDQQMIPDTWMNDIGEKIPNWFESARLFYQYTGDAKVMELVTQFIDYTIAHGTSSASDNWPYFPYTTANAGDTLYRGFTDSKKLVLHEVQVDHAGDMGFTYFKLYQYTGNEKYKTAAIHVADALAAHARIGTKNKSVWPYRVVTDDGRVTAEYGANWMGAYALLELLVKTNTGQVPAYRAAMAKVQDFMLRFPMQTGYWTDGHTDTDVSSDTYKSNMSASNMSLYLFDHPAFDPDFKKDIPMLIRWTEENFVTRSANGEPSTQWGANIVGEQDSFLPKMDYQTARYGAACARWFALSGDSSYRERAYRSLNWVTYCSDSNGLAFESPLSRGVTSWWSDCYGEGPRMFYQALAVIPEWAPQHEDHILYSTGVLKNVLYGSQRLQYTSPDTRGIEYINLSFKPAEVKLDNKILSGSQSGEKNSWYIRPVDKNDYYLIVRRDSAGTVYIK